MPGTEVVSSSAGRIILADIAVDVEQASRHLRLLHHGADGFASLVLLGSGKRERHGFAEVHDLLQPVADRTEARDSYEELADTVAARWNVYTACSTFAKVPEKGRGTRTDVLSVPGVWADLDVKPDSEYFSTEAHLVQYMSRLPTPTLEVSTGSGGRHLYWLTKQRLAPDVGQKLLHRWLDYLRSEAVGTMIDPVQDTVRILRLAGTVRWPKVDDAQSAIAQRVVLLHDNGPRYDAEELELISDAAFHNAEDQRSLMRVAQTNRKAELADGLAKYGPDRIAIHNHHVSWFNANEDWEKILLRDGWTLFSDSRGSSSRCRYWTRPGKDRTDGKSASTDWISDDRSSVSNTMTIYSQDAALLDLWESTSDTGLGLCSKYHYARVRLYGKDENKLLQALKAGNWLLP